MAIAGILFDKDGTLLDYWKTWVPVNRKLALYAAAGDEALAAELMRAGGMDPETGHVLPDSLLAAGNTLEIAEGLVAAGARVTVHDLTHNLDDLFAQAALDAVPVTDLSIFFARLKARGLKLGVASSDNELSIRRTADRFGFSSSLDYVCGYDSGFGCKPDPGMVTGFLAATGLNAAEVAVVGDNNHDMLMARRAGAGLAVGVLTGTGTRQSLSVLCDHCLEDITGLEDLL